MVLVMVHQNDFDFSQICIKYWNSNRFLCNRRLNQKNMIKNHSWKSLKRLSIYMLIKAGYAKLRWMFIIVISLHLPKYILFIILFLDFLVSSSMWAVNCWNLRLSTSCVSWRRFWTSSRPTKRLVYWWIYSFMLRSIWFERFGWGLPSLIVTKRNRRNKNRVCLHAGFDFACFTVKRIRIFTRETKHKCFSLLTISLWHTICIYLYQFFFC